jgi:hypothetical protein
MLLRALVLGLVVANLLFFAWARGWFAPTWPAPRHGEREPERLGAQVQPEAVTLVPVLPTSGAGVSVGASVGAAAGGVAGMAAAQRLPAPTCQEVGPLDDTSLGPAEAALIAAQLPTGSWTRLIATPAPTWLVYAGRAANDVARKILETELRQSGLTLELIDAPTDLAPGLAVSRHLSRGQAETALAQVLNKANAANATNAANAANAANASTVNSPALKGLRVVALPTPPPQYWLRAEKVDAALQTRLSGIPAQDAKDALAGGFRPCSLRP